MKTWRREHKVSVDGTVYMISTWKDTKPALKNGFCWSSIGGGVEGWTEGTRAEALKEAREILYERKVASSKAEGTSR